MDRRTLIAALPALLVTPRPAAAAPQRYVLDPEASQVAFTFSLEGIESSGTMPIASADLWLDFDRVARSSARVTLDAAGARTGLIFVTEALKSPEVLDTARHPMIVFESRQIGPQPGGARIVGDVTIRGVTRPLALDAAIYRRAGSEPGDLSRLTVRLTGALSRSAFGADGYAGFVEDRVGLQITARLLREP